MATADLVLYTDGGSSAGSVAAAASLITDPNGTVVHGLVTLLGEATNNEAEIFASLMSFAWIRAHHPDAGTVRWVADSEYTLKSATAYIKNWQKNGWKTADKKPVKNQGLWRTYLAVSRGLTLIPEHVRGHTGHPPNETCDEALNWAKVHGDDELTSDPAVEVEIPDLPIDAPWLLFDGRPVLRSLRCDEPEASAIEHFQELMAAVAPSAHQADRPRREPPAPSLAPLVKDLQQAHRTATGLSARDERAAKVAQHLEKLLTALR